MKKHRLTLRGYLAVSVFSLFFIITPTMSANQATVNIKGKVRAVCNIDVPSVVNMPDLNFDDLKPGVSLTSKSAAVNVKGTCSGGVKIKYTISVPSLENYTGCFGTIPRSIALCLRKDNDPMPIDKDRNIIIENAPGEFSITINPTGVSGLVAKVSEYTSSFTIKIEPM